jgi:ribosome-associated protein
MRKPLYEYSTIMIQVTHDIAINEAEVHEDFVHSSGPGGQNVNKVATAVQLRFDVRNSPSLPDEVRRRLVTLAGSRITGDGILIIRAQRFRTQGKNREDAVQQLVELVRRATHRPKIRRKTKPSAASQQRRLDSKRRHSQIKTARRSVSDD